MFVIWNCITVFPGYIYRCICYNRDLILYHLEVNQTNESYEGILYTFQVLIELVNNHRIILNGQCLS